MWRTPEGDRVLTEAEWALFRVGLGALWDFIEDDRDENAGLSETGIRVFDVLPSEQKIALLADVGQALRDPAIPTPQHTAANEAAIAAVFATLRSALEGELLEAIPSGSAAREIRQLLLNALADSAEIPEELPALTESDPEQWDLVLEAAEARLLWDADYEMGDEFLDQPPEQAGSLLALTRIDPECYTAIPREPNHAGLVAARQTLAGLLGPRA